MAKGEKKYKIAFVCTGNTCRSPMAQFIMRRKLKEAGIDRVTVCSFGTFVTESAINENALKALKKLKIRVTKFTPKQMPENVGKKYDAVIFMTRMQKQNFCGRVENAYSIGELCACPDIADPYGKGEEEYDNCAAAISDCADVIIEYLKKVIYGN